MLLRGKIQWRDGRWGFYWRRDVPTEGASGGRDEKGGFDWEWDAEEIENVRFGR